MGFSLSNNETTAIEHHPAGETVPADVYSVSGQLVKKNVMSLDGLPKGLYIVNGKKLMKK